MGNPQHLEWLLEGVEAWNARRKAEVFDPDFRDVDIREAFTKAGKLGVLDRIPLGGADLDGANLRGADLDGANLREAVLRGADLREAVLRGADLREADLGGANLGEAVLREAVLRRAVLVVANLGGAVLEGADLGGAVLRGADLREADLRGADLGTVYLGVGANDWGTPKYTDLRAVRHLSQEKLNAATGDRGVLLPEGLDYPEHWPLPPHLVEEDRPVTPETDRKEPPSNSLNITVSASPLGRAIPVVEVTWKQGELDATFRLTAEEPTLPDFHPAVPSTEIDLLSSLGQLATQASNMLATNTPENALAFTGDATTLFNAIADEVNKPNGLVLSFVLEANISAIEALRGTDAAEALREVDAAFIDSFLGVANKWRDQSAVLKAATDPTNSEIVPEDRLDAIEEAENRLVALITDNENAHYMGPSLPGVTRDMALYPWDPEDIERDRRMRAAALGTLAVRIGKALINPPEGVKTNVGFYSALAGAIAAILALFKA